MMIVLNQEDFRRLSNACQQEIMETLLQPQSTIHPEEELPFFWAEEAQHLTENIRLDVTDKEREVVSIDLSLAKELVARISEKSLSTLKLFTSCEPVQLDALIGEGRPYRDFNDLKRSFVGAVNRRLRTITGNRNAVFFASDPEKTRIRVTAQSASSLSEVLSG